MKQALRRTPWLIALVLIWLFLWGDFGVGRILSGLVVSAIVVLLFPMPPIAIGVRPHPFRLLVVIVSLGWELVAGSFRVGAMVLRRDPPRSAVIEVPVPSRSDLALTFLAIAFSVTPGSSAIEVWRHPGRIYVHVLGVKDKADVEKTRKSAHLLTERVLLALGAKK
ncbi:Na+/H+ antiporter subunit E [Spiractinospora alimapuensis]|uniref:Na+/H+ antiporter subunit E n=1 Tax=Spiractinospora alimapuensis TaxID=2820884 RepID=UPI001F34C98A|nr:Na+/H+ antiporter subunit E [Spiractinospora alimapuensis]QVQ53540.1 Na+/H+ antiporter subunit E [Spiractinospora alimapuensis]